MLLSSSVAFNSSSMAGLGASSEVGSGGWISSWPTVTCSSSGHRWTGEFRECHFLPRRWWIEGCRGRKMGLSDRAGGGSVMNPTDEHLRRFLVRYGEALSAGD